MKAILRVITFAALPLLSSNPGWAQNEPLAPPPVPAVNGAEDDAGKADDQARQQFQRARQELDRARADGDRARQESDRANQQMTVRTAGSATGFSDRLQTIIRRSPDTGFGGGSAKPIVIRSSPMDAKAQANLEEDLAIMARVLDKALEEPTGPQRPYTAMGIDVFTTGSSPMRDFYLDGYGAVFMLHVGLPLLPPPQQAEEKIKSDTQTDSTWEQAREELYGQGPAGMPAAPAEEFSEAKVDQLKTRLLEALKSASNIRQMKPNDSVTVCVSGGPTGGRFGKSVRFHTAVPPTPKAPHAASWVATNLGPGGPRGTIMTLRARKSDIDAFAKGNMDRERFSKAVSIETYAGTAGGPAGAGTVISGFGTGGQF